MGQSPKKTFDKTANKANDHLPTWDLDTLFGYDGYGSESFEADFSKMEKLVDAFVEKYKGKTRKLSGDALAEAFEAEEKIGSLLGKMYTYTYEKQTQDVPANAANLQNFQNRLPPVTNKLIFFGDELKKISNKKYKEMLADSERLQRWSPVIDNVIKGKPHKVDPEIAEYSSKLGAMGHITGMHGRRQAELRFTLDGEEFNLTQITDIIADDPDQRRRAAAQAEFERVLGEDAWFNAEIHNGLIKFKSVSDEIAKFDNPEDSRHFDNNVEPEVVDALETAVKGAYERTSHRFYALKAKLMEQEQLHIYDRNFNIFTGENEPEISWDEAKQIVLDAFYSFDQRAGEVAEMFFDNGWIDAAVTKNKAGGAHAHPGAAALLHPLVMVNFQGKPGDVSTLAHELGHGIHQYLEANNEAAVVSTPLTLAETASVFGEMLTL